MRLFTMCVVSVLLWNGVDALAQGKGQNKGPQAPVKENAPKADKVLKNSEAAAETAAKDAAKGNKGGKGQESATPSTSRQGGAHGKKAETLSDAVEKGKGKAGQQLQSMQKQLQHEQAKHMERSARLARIRELAAQKGDTATVARVDKLIEKEKMVYGRKLEHMQGQKRATQQPGEAGKEMVTPPATPDTTGRPPVAPDAGKPAQAPTGNAAGQPAGPSTQPGTNDAHGTPKK